MNRDIHIYFYGADGGPLGISFEEAAERLEDLGYAYFEPDGSFAITDRQTREQIYGMLYDAHGQLQYVELRGRCGKAVWSALIACFVDPSTGQANGRQATSVKELPDRPLQDLQSFEATLFAAETP